MASCNINHTEIVSHAKCRTGSWVVLVDEGHKISVFNIEEPHGARLNMQNLPSHRQFLTSLIGSLSAGQSQLGDGEPHLIPPDRRQLLLTLHVLFPSLLLPALDLLDRQLVASVRTANPKPAETGSQLYIVKSLGTTLSRRSRDAASASRSYVVRLEAWNCSCVSFALDAFPVGMRPAGDGNDRGEQEERWFGGLSLDSLAGAGEDVPCCKHLLACLLAERWHGFLGGYVESKEVSREELAGMLAGL